jgi:pimeloyl-ACP methyl ester carboxylesterase
MMQLALDGQITSVQSAPDRRRWRVVAAAVFFAGVVWCIAVLGLWIAEPQLVFMTGLSRSYTAPFDPAIFQVVTFPSTDGLTLNGVVLRHDAARDRYWILFCPPAGASTRVQRIQGQLKALSSLGYNVFAFDYRGFGDSPGLPTEDGLYADATAAHAHLVQRLGVSPSRIIVAGRSLGSAVATDLATRVDAAGLLLFAPIDSVPQVAARLYPWAPARLLASHRFDTSAKAARVSAPVVVVYASPDRFMPVIDVRSLFHEFRGRKAILQTGGGHHFAGFIYLSDLNRVLTEFWPAR